ncbi:Transketolase [Operophtera brumata]|uniref:Transketolase n=1 Tax=Operophtera brumata TaxID=104452 RepID=A0A0L7LIK8_OPEBR|nr:Transketolase [Operophtera brumata]
MKGEQKIDVQALKDIANKLRIDSIVATNASKSGCYRNSVTRRRHPTSCASMAEIMSVLFFHTMRYKVSAPRDASADRFILSKGHAAPILYAAWAEAGLFPVEDLKNLRKLDSDLEGHPTPRLNFVDVGTGSLGQGLAHLESLIKSPTITLAARPPLAEAPRVHLDDITLSAPPAYKAGELVATRLAVIALDGDTKNSTFSDKLRNAYPDRYIECFIAEQNLVGVATGAACRDRAVVFASTFAAFFTRTFDQPGGSHCGVSIGEDGPSQMRLEDIALFRSVPTATVVYPREYTPTPAWGLALRAVCSSDAVSTERAVELAANTKGICYIRTSRPNTNILYANDEVFKVGQAKIIRQSPKDKVLLIGAGVTLHEAIAAADKLKEEGGVGEAVLSALALERDVIVKHVFVQEVPRSGPPAVLLDKYGISAPHIVAAAQQLLKA